MSTPDPEERRTCDIVMKGGITSGVVYPKAITRLARRYTFKNIGGTSAGAIAASIAAAAEYRRHEGGGDAGFACLDALPGLLGEKPGRGERTRLFYFFQPNARTRRIFEVVTGTLGGGPEALKATLRRVLEEYAGWTSTGMIPGLVLGLASLVFAQGPMVPVWVLFSTLIAAGGAVLSAIAGFVLEFIREIPRNGYGLCSGVVEPPQPGERRPPRAAEPLSVWLTNYLNTTAGLDEKGAPLTFGHLWSNGGESDPEKAALPRRTNLEMMTTSITHSRPYRLPFRDDRDLRENHRFYFRPEEFRRYFPESVVQWMVDHPRPIVDSPSRALDRIEHRTRLADLGYRPLPAPADLPVVVATRMSLSFPILLCAVPLHGFVHEREEDRNEMPAPCWFSDGGMTSNFPLHFFDTALPRRPTFSIDLIDKAGHPTPEELLPEMDEDNGLLAERWNQFDREPAPSPTVAGREKPDLARLLGFFGAMIGTMQNWSDTTQARLPGYRDRIVRVPLSSEEGGLNLDMPAPRIAALSARGVQAAEQLLKHFDVPPEHSAMTWDNHRWIRLRSLLGALEKMLGDTLHAWDCAEIGDDSYAAWLQQMIDGTAEVPKYKRMTKVQLRATIATLQKLSEIPDLWPPGKPPSEDSPRPRPVLRPRAQI